MSLIHAEDKYVFRYYHKRSQQFIRSVSDVFRLFAKLSSFFKILPQVICEELTSTDQEFLNKCDPHLMDTQTLKQVFGEKVASAQMVLFQHGTRITDQADFMDPDKCIKVRKGDRSLPTRYRKSQMHPTVWAEALKSAINCSDLPLMSNDVAVILTGGPPEAVVGALAVGYRTVIYIGSNNAEVLMMTLPTEAEQVSGMVDYSEYSGLLNKT